MPLEAQRQHVAMPTLLTFLHSSPKIITVSAYLGTKLISENENTDSLNEAWELTGLCYVPR